MKTRTLTLLGTLYRTTRRCLLFLPLLACVACGDLEREGTVVEREEKTPQALGLQAVSGQLHTEEATSSSEPKKTTPSWFSEKLDEAAGKLDSPKLKKAELQTDRKKEK